MIVGVNPDDRSYANRLRAESFGSIAQSYDRARPSYPPALIDFLLAGTRPDVLDVGCGTGIASRLLAGRGAHVLGLEIDDRMAAVARSRGTDVITSPFETWDPQERTFDLITCAQAWHWIEPSAGAAKAAEVLRPGGRLAPFWNYAELTEEQRAALAPVYAQVGSAARDSVLLGRGGDTVEGYRRDLERTGRFTSIERHNFGWDHSYSNAQWITLISTHSDHLALPDDVRARLFDAVRAAIDDLGGYLDVHYDTSVLVARIASQAPSVASSST